MFKVLLRGVSINVFVPRFYPIYGSVSGNLPKAWILHPMSRFRLLFEWPFWRGHCFSRGLHSTIPGDNNQLLMVKLTYRVHLSDKSTIHGWVNVYHIQSFHGNPSLECCYRRDSQDFLGNFPWRSISTSRSLEVSAATAGVSGVGGHNGGQKLKIQLSRDQLNLVICCI